jgi:glycosyltransferase involved in cell wall biosynthesis
MKILLLNYYWPPCGGPAVQRWLYIIKYLSELGFECHVLTVDPQKAYYQTLDYSLNSQIPRSTKVYHSKSRNFLGFYSKWFNKGQVPSPAIGEAKGWKEKIARFIRGNFFLPDPRKGWNPYALSKALQIIKQNQIEVVFTAGPPHSTHLVGMALKKQTSVFWVADLHDYWTNIAYLENFYRTSLAEWIDNRLERSVLLNSDAVMTHCESSKRYFSQKHGLSLEKIRVHSIGFDEELFEAAKSVKPRPAQPKTEFIIAYTGTIAGFYGADAIFAAMSLAKKNWISTKIKLVLVGKTDYAIQSMPKKYDLETEVEFLGYKSHRESVEVLLQSHALFLVNPICEAERIHVPGKLYEYLAAQKPIINLAPLDSEVAQIILDCKAGKTFLRSQIQEIANYLIELAQQSSLGQNFEVRQEKIEKYGRKAETYEMAKWIKSLR